MKHKRLLKIDFENKQEKLPLTYKVKMLVRAAVEATLDYEQYENDVEVSVTFTDNEQIKELNLQFRGIDRSTDVLSFPLFDFEGESEEPLTDELQGMLGDIVLSLEQAEIQANEFGHSFEREVAFLCVHSMLHLLGYDHVDEGEMKRQMRGREEKIASQIPGMKRD